MLEIQSGPYSSLRFTAQSILRRPLLSHANYFRLLNPTPAYKFITSDMTSRISNSLAELTIS